MGNVPGPVKDDCSGEEIISVARRRSVFPAGQDSLLIIISQRISHSLTYCTIGNSTIGLETLQENSQTDFRISLLGFTNYRRDKDL